MNQVQSPQPIQFELLTEQEQYLQLLRNRYTQPVDTPYYTIPLNDSSEKLAQILSQLDHPFLLKLSIKEYRSNEIIFRKERLMCPFYFCYYQAEQPLLNQLILQVASALFHMHRCGLVHRNIGFTAIHGISFEHVVLGGFQCVQRCPGTIGCCRKYLSPEAQFGITSYNYSDDIWAFGMFCYQVATFFEPFAETASGYRNLTVEPRWDVIKDAELRALCQRCLCEDPAERRDLGRIISECFDLAIYQMSDHFYGGPK